MRAIPLVIGVAVAATALGGSAASSAERAQASASRTVIVGGTAGERALLRGIVLRLGGTSIARIAVVPSTKYGVLLEFEPRGTSTTPDQYRVRLQWEESLVAAMYKRRARAAGLRTAVDFSGVLHPLQSRELRLATCCLRPFRREHIVTPVRSAVRQAGGKLVELNLFRPADPAFAVVVQAARPAAFVQRRLGRIILALNTVARRRLAGFYVAVTDRTRSVVFAYSALEVLGTYTYFVRPDLLGCAKELPIANEVAPDLDPPCPSG